MKLLSRVPKHYQHLSVGMLSAGSIVFVGLFVNAILPNPERNRQPSNADNASGIVITPVNPSNRESADVTPRVSAPVTGPDNASLESSTQVPSEQISNRDIDAYAEPYDDLPTTRDLPSTKYNHFSYAETDQNRLASIGLFVRESYEREEWLDYEAAEAFAQMKADAAVEGIFLMPISGFRTIALQAELFAEQAEKLGGESEAAKLSAPPGHSEHHTGYAIDIGDANVPDADVKYAFESTPAYGWLVANARRYGFEESFPKGNQQGVSFEPWHWRYVDSPRASETFINSRSVFPVP